MTDVTYQNGWTVPVWELNGISLRDAMAMSVHLPESYSAKWGEALIGEPVPTSTEPVAAHIDWWMRVEAAYRYRMADAMLKERENKS